MTRQAAFVILLVVGIAGIIASVLYFADRRPEPQDTPRYTQEQVDLAIIHAGGACDGSRYQGRGIWNCQDVFTFDETNGHITGLLPRR